MHIPCLLTEKKSDTDVHDMACSLGVCAFGLGVQAQVTVVFRVFASASGMRRPEFRGQRIRTNKLANLLLHDPVQHQHTCPRATAVKPLDELIEIEIELALPRRPRMDSRALRLLDS